MRFFISFIGIGIFLLLLKGVCRLQNSKLTFLFIFQFLNMFPAQALVISCLHCFIVLLYAKCFSLVLSQFFPLSLVFSSLRTIYKCTLLFELFLLVLNKVLKFICMPFTKLCVFGNYFFKYFSAPSNHLFGIQKQM